MMQGLAAVAVEETFVCGILKNKVDFLQPAALFGGHTGQNN